MIDIVVSISGSIPGGEVKWFNTSLILLYSNFIEKTTSVLLVYLVKYLVRNTNDKYI